MNHASQRRMAKSEAESERKTVNFHIAENEENEAHQAFILNEESTVTSTKESSKNTRNPFRIFRRRRRIQTGKNRAQRNRKTQKRPKMMSKVKFRNLKYKSHEEYLICRSYFV